MIRTGAVGAAGTALCGTIPVLALCCATPAATLALGAAGVGLAGAAVRLEWLWLLAAPLLAFLALLAYGLHRQHRAAAAEACRGLEHGGPDGVLPNAGCR